MRKFNKASLFIKARDDEWKKIGEIDGATHEFVPDPQPPVDWGSYISGWHDITFTITKIHPLALPPPDCDIDSN